MSNSEKLRVGIIIDDVNQPYLVHDLYQKSLNNDFYSLEYLIIQRPIGINNKNLIDKLINYVKKKGIIRLLDRLIFEFIDKIESQIVKRENKFKKFFLKHPISKFEIEKVYVEPKVSSSGLYYRYDTEEIDKIKKLNLDILIRGGSGILQGEILKICRLGILSFHHGDNDFYRGGPPGFWEVYNREPSTGFIIQRLSEILDGGDVIFKGNIQTSFFYKLNVCKLFLKSNIFLHKTLEKMSKNIGDLNYYPKSSDTFKIYKIPKSYQSIFYFLKTFFIFLKKTMNKAFGWSFRWSVSYQFTKNWQNPHLKNSKIIKNPKNRFLADPFVINHKNKNIIYVEDYDYKVKKGKISAYDINSESYTEIGVALEEKFHLSYPFLIKSKEDLFMIPDTHEAKDIRIYKCIEFPLKWKFHKILINNISAVDTNIIKHNNKYWLFTNKDSSSIGDHSSELHIFYADDLESSIWKPHSLNPVIFDSKKARNGGTISSKENQLYRVFQKQDFDFYGASLGVSKIKKLTENEYQEEVFMNILPDFYKNILGIHSFSFDANILVNDLVRYEKIN